MVYHPRDYGLPLPKTFRTEFRCEADYKVPVATAAITGGAVKLNSVWLPFRPTGATAFPSFTFLGPATETTLMPTGATSLINGNLYSSSKVIRAEMKCRWNGTSSGNNVIFTIVPALGGTSFSDVYHARTYPLARTCSFSVSKPNENVGKDGWFRYSIDPYRIYGYTNAEAKADIQENSASPNSDPPFMQYWNFFIQTMDNDVTAVAANVLQVRLRWVVDLMAVDFMPVT